MVTGPMQAHFWGACVLYALQCDALTEAVVPFRDRANGFDVVPVYLRRGDLFPHESQVVGQEHCPEMSLAGSIDAAHKRAIHSANCHSVSWLDNVHQVVIHNDIDRPRELTEGGSLRKEGGIRNQKRVVEKNDT